MEGFILSGLLIGTGAGFFYILVGRLYDTAASYASLLGIFLQGDFFKEQSRRQSEWQSLFTVGGLMTGGFLAVFLFWPETSIQTDVPISRLFYGGILVGIGATIARGGLINHTAYAVSEFPRSTFLTSISFLIVVVTVAYITRLLLFI